MARVIPKSKIKPAPKRKPALKANRILSPETEKMLNDLHLREMAKSLEPLLSPKQRLLLTGCTMAAVVGLIAEYPRRHTIDFEGIVKARFLDGVHEIQHKEREAGLKGGLADLAEADCRMTLEVPND